MMKLTVFMSVVAFLPSTAHAFVVVEPPSSVFASRPSLSNQHPIRIRRLKSSSSTTELSETTKENMSSIGSGEGGEGGEGGGEWNIGAPSQKILEATRKRRVARNALNKLLERQRRDLRQTHDLLASLDDVGDSVDGESEDNELRPQKHIFDVKNVDVYFDLDDDGTVASLPSIISSITASVAAGADYGYTSRSEGCRSESIKSRNYLVGDDARFEGYGPPGNIFALGSQQFMRNLRAMIGEYNEEPSASLTAMQRELQSQLRALTLNSTAIWERERDRGPVIAPYVIKVPYYALCYLLDVVFEGRNAFSRFFLLETVARMPYFSYITMLHLYETLGFWRRSADIKRIHFAEEWNEFHHLLIMESLGGDQPFWVRFLSQHSALAYYLALCILWMLSPSLSYKFSEMLETHAVDTYSQFVDENESRLKQLPPTLVAVEYYTIGLSDPMFGEYQTASVMDPLRSHEGGGGVRKPGTDLRSLYDVMVAIRNDEGDHVHTMMSCLDPKVAVLSPALEGRVLTGIALAAGSSLFFGATGFGSLGGGVGLNDIEGVANIADGMTDLDSILTEDGSLGAAVVGGLAGLANGLQELFGAEAEVVDDDVTGSTLENIAASGIDGFEMESILELVKSIILGILEFIGLGL